MHDRVCDQALLPEPYITRLETIHHTKAELSKQLPFSCYRVSCKMRIYQSIKLALSRDRTLARLLGCILINLKHLSSSNDRAESCILPSIGEHIYS